jgi:anti-anti-sigma factor
VRDELSAHTSQHGFELVVDLSETRYLDSAGIDMIFRLSRRMRERRATLRLVISPESELGRLAEIVGIPSAIPVHDDVAQAIDAARRSRPSERVDP